MACAELGLAEVPTLCLDHLTPAQARAFMIADNRLTEIGTWDDRLLAKQLKELSVQGLDFALEVTGFEMGEIDLRIASLEEPLEPEDDPADMVLDVPIGQPLSKIGDDWILGPHRVLLRQCPRSGGLRSVNGRRACRNDLLLTRPTTCRSVPTQILF